MAGSTPQDQYRPVYVIEIYLDSGLYTFSTRDLQVGDNQQTGFGEEGLGEGGFGGD